MNKLDWLHCENPKKKKKEIKSNQLVVYDNEIKTIMFRFIPYDADLRISNDINNRQQNGPNVFTLNISVTKNKDLITFNYSIK